jgi:hypothetical protein
MIRSWSLYEPPPVGGQLCVELCQLSDAPAQLGSVVTASRQVWKGSEVWSRELALQLLGGSSKVMTGHRARCSGPDHHS